MSTVTPDESIEQTRPEILTGMTNSDDDTRVIKGLPIGLAISLPLWAMIILVLLAIF
jgi:hypothetical protein